MAKKKSAGKKTPATPTIPQASNEGTSGVTTPTSSFAKEDQKDVSEPVRDEPKNATSSTEENPTDNAATTIADTPAAPLSKTQKKKAAAARKAAAAAALANDNASSQQPETTEEVDTPITPVDSSEAKTNMTKSLDESETSKPLENTPAPEPEQDHEGDAWGLNEGDPAEGDHDVAKPAADETPAPGAQDSSSADGVPVATVEPKSEATIPNDTGVLSGDKATESVPPPPAEVSSDAVPNLSNGAPSPDTSDPHETNNDTVVPSTEVTLDAHAPNVDTTKPNGTFNCEPMDLPPRPSDDDNTPLSQFSGHAKPIVDTNFTSDGLVNARTQTPSLAGENLGSAQSGSNSNITGTGVFSNSPSRTNAPSASPTSGVPARGPGAVGFGTAAPQTPTITPGFGFGFGSPQKSTLKTASGMSWSSSPPSKPAAKAGWGGWLNKARETIEQVIGDEPSPAPAPSSRAPSVRSPSVDRPAQSPLMGPPNSNSNPNATPASPSRPTKGMTAFEMKMAALSKKAVTGPNKDSSPAPMPETPKASSSAIPPSDSGASPISPSQSTQSYTQSHPSPLPLPPSTNEPTEQTAPQTPDQAEVTSAFLPPPRESTAETGNVGKLISKFDIPEAPISSKMTTTGLQLHTQPVAPDGRRSASSMTKRGSIGSETGRPSLADMRSSSAPTPKTPITSASPKTPASFSFGPGLGTTNRFNGGGLFGGGRLAGFRPNHGPSPMSTPVTENNEAKPGNQNDLDDLSSVVESSEVQDLDSQVGESEPQDLDSLVDESGVDALPNLPINIDIDSPAIPTTFNTTTFNTTIPDVAPSYANPWDSSPAVIAEALPSTTLEVTTPLSTPTKFEFEPEVAIADDKTIADPSDLADVEPEPAPKDEPPPESPVLSEHAVTPVAEKPAEVLVLEEPVVAPAVTEPVVPPVTDEQTVSPAVDEPIVVPVPHEEVPVSEPTEPVAAPEPPVDEPPPEISVEVALEPPVESVAEPAIEPTVEPTVELIVPVVELAAEPAVGVAAEPTTEAIPEPASEPTVETVVEPAIEPTPEPVVQLIVEPPEPVAVPSVEPVSEPVVESAVASTLEPPVEPSFQPLPPSPIEPPVMEWAPVVPTEAPIEKPAPPKLTLDVPPADESSKSKSPLPPTPATPATPATAGKKKKKKGKKGVADSEPVPVIPETISEPASQSEPASKSEPVSISEPAPAEPEVEPIPEVVEPAPTVEVLPAPEAPKEPETTPEPVQEKPKEEPVSPAKSKKSKKKRKSSAAPTQVTSPTNDVPPTPIEKAEQPGVEVVEVVEVAEPAVTEPVVAEPTAVEPTVVEPAVAEPVVVESVSGEPVSIEPVSVEISPVEPVVLEPVLEVEVVPSPEAEEVTKNEDNRTAVPDEGFETPKVAPRELPELVPEPVETVPQSPVVEVPVEAIVIPPTEIEPSPEPMLAPPSTEVYPEVIPIPEPQLELEPESESEPVTVPVVEPTVDPVVEVVIEPPADIAAEVPVEPAYEPVPELVSVPSVEPIAELAIEPPVEEIIIEEVQPVAEFIPELQVQPSTEPVFELAASPVEEAPKEEEPTLEVKDANPSPSKSSKKKDKKKGAARAAVVTEEPVLSPANDEPVEIVKPETLITSTPEDNEANEIAVIPSAIAPKKKKGKKPKAVSVVSTPVQEKAPTLPLPVEAPATLVDTPQMEKMEEVLVTVAPLVEVLESPVQSEATPKIEVIELPDNQDAEAASIIRVAQIHPDVTTSTQLTLPAIEAAPIELVSEVLPEPEPMPVLVDLPQSPATSALSISSPRLSIPSPWPQEAFLATWEASPRSVTPNMDKHDETLEVPQIPISPVFRPVRPVLEHVVSAEVTVPLSPSPVSDSASQSSQDIGSFGREASARRESQPFRRTGSVSSITSIDTDSPSAVEKAKMRPSMPPLISIPIHSPVATSNPHLDLAIQQPPAQAEPERKLSPKIAEGPAPSTVTNDLPTNDVPLQPDATAKPSSSGILDGFSPLRWFGFGGLSPPVVENKPAEVKQVDVMPVEVKTVEVKPVEPIDVKPVEVKPAEIKTTELKPIETKPVQVNPIDVHLIVAKAVETPVAVLSPDPKAADDRGKEPKVTLVPIRKPASPSSPESPAIEKTAWSRWPYQPTMITSIPPVQARVPLARDSVPIPTRADGQITPPRPGRVPPVSTMPPILPIVPVSAVSPSTPAKSDAPHSRRSHRTNGAATPLTPTPIHIQDTSTNEGRRGRPTKRPSPRVTSPMPNPAVVFQSPSSSEDSLPAYTYQAPSVDRDSKPVPRGILKQHISPPATPPEAETPNPARATPQAPKFEFTDSRNVPTYDWNHAPLVRKDVLNNTSIPQSREVQPPLAATTLHSSRSRITGDSNHRSRSKYSSKELGSLPNKVNRPRTPSPLRETRATSKTTVTPPKPNLVPVLNEKIIRAKASKPAKISTTRTTGDVYIQPLTSPILLTSENYGGRLPENRVYQYDGISPSESLSPTSRKAIFDVLQKQVAPQIFPVFARPNFDGKKMLYAQRRLNVSSKQEFLVELPEHGQEPRVYTVQLKRLAVITPQ